MKIAQTKQLIIFFHRKGNFFKCVIYIFLFGQKKVVSFLCGSYSNGGVMKGKAGHTGRK